MTRTTSNLIAFLGGFAAGITVGILYAPDSGKNTREKIRNRLSKYYDQLKNVVQEKQQIQDQGDYLSSYKEREDYRKAQELLNEVENILDELKGKDNATA
ncbi:MAG: YtxH domain-containing protein [Bacteroidetes bacterium]|nr:YtxH domain-containing protein [Bacteroidota bacterium]